MKKVFLLLLITNFLFSQDINGEKILEQFYQKVKNQNGFTLHFDYIFDNNENKKPINGKIAFFDNQRFYLEFISETEIIQIFNGKDLFTILNEEKEIQIDYLNNKSDLFIQNIFSDFKEKFNLTMKDEFNQIAKISLTPKTISYQYIFNNCIDELALPLCLKLPNQCRIGLDSISTKKLNECIEKNNKISTVNISNIELEIDYVNNLLKSVIQKNKYNSVTKMVITKTTTSTEDCLNIDKKNYKNYEIIDLR